ncbi:MAG: hypothetical protein WBK77_01335 [Alphaproteobacteria bacterium]
MKQRFSEEQIIRVLKEHEASCVGKLTSHPTGGMFLANVPHENLAFLLSALNQNLFRYILLSGAPLSRGKSLCRSIHFTGSVNLEDY